MFSITYNTVILAHDVSYRNSCIIFGSEVHFRRNNYNIFVLTSSIYINGHLAMLKRVATADLYLNKEHSPCKVREHFAETATS